MPVGTGTHSDGDVNVVACLFMVDNLPPAERPDDDGATLQHGPPRNDASLVVARCIPTDDEWADASIVSDEEDDAAGAPIEGARCAFRARRVHVRKRTLCRASQTSWRASTCRCATGPKRSRTEAPRCCSFATQTASCDEHTRAVDVCPVDSSGV